MNKDISRIKKLTEGKKIITKSEWIVAALISLEERAMIQCEETPA
jgi:hypothetical protein